MAILENPKHEVFAQELAKGKSATDAYLIAAGKKNRRYASELGQRPDIAGRVQDILAEREARHAQATAAAIEAEGLTKAWIIARLRENAERALQAIPVMKNGVETGEFIYEGSVANRALELLGKELGMFVDRSVVDQTTYTVSAEPTAEEWVAEHAAETVARH